MSRTNGSPVRLQGYMSLKSSPFNPVSGKLSSQHMVVDHMNAHYKKIERAKSAIDSKPPKAYVSSQKVRDRVQREKMMAGGGILPSKPGNTGKGSRKNRLMSEDRSHSMQNLAMYQQTAYEAQDEYEMNYLNSMYDEQMYVRQGQGHATNRSSNVSQVVSPGHMQSMTKDTNSRKKMSGDILDKRGHKFTEPEAMFTPRILKRDAPSHLSKNSKTYCQGRPRSSTLRRSHSQQSIRASSESASNILDETLVSRDFTTRLQQSGSVPPLDISLDADHIKWLKEQAIHTEKRRRNSGTKSAAPSLNGATLSNSTFNRVHRGKTEATLRSTKPAQGNMNMSWTMKKLKDDPKETSSKVTEKHLADDLSREDELRYLDFIKEVTNDVLTRGIFTNRVLRQVFEQHMQKQKGLLDENRMRQMIDSLREDLGIPKEDADVNSPEDVGMGDRRPPIMAVSKVTGKSSYSASQPFASDDDDFDRGFSTEPTLLKTGKQPFDFVVRPSLEDVKEESEKTHSSKSRESSRRLEDLEKDLDISNDLIGENTTLTEISFLENMSATSKDTINKGKELDSSSNASNVTLTNGEDGSMKGADLGVTLKRPLKTIVPEPRPRARQDSVNSQTSAASQRSRKSLGGGSRSVGSKSDSRGGSFDSRGGSFDQDDGEGEDAMYSDNFSDGGSF